MGKVLHSRVDGLSEANALFTFAASQSDIYIKFRVAFAGAALGPSMGAFFYVDDTGNGGGAEGLFLDDTVDELHTWWDTNGPFPPELSLSTWYEIEMHAQIVATNMVTTLAIDGVDVGAITNAGGATGFTGMVSIIVGWFNSAPGTPADVYIDDITIGTAGSGSSDVFGASFEGATIVPPFDSTTLTGSGVLEVVDDPFPAVTPPVTPSLRFFRDFPWRFVVTDIDPMGTLTFLDRIATDRTVTLTINQPAVSSGLVASDSPEVNITVDSPDDEPFIHHNDRFLFGFRREGGDPKWVVRFSGLIMQTEDVAADPPQTRYTAYDPWEYLNHRPVLNGDGDFPGQNGLSFNDTAGSTIALALLENTVLTTGDVYIDYGQTAFYEGTIESTVPIDINFQQGLTVGEAWTQLCNSGTMDIWLKPIYDPINRPGLIAELSIYSLMGAPKYDAVFAWDKPSRSLVGVSRLNDGTQMANHIQYWAGKNQEVAGVEVNAASTVRYNEWWSMQFFPGQSKVSLVELLALAQVFLRANGARVLNLDPAPERAPIPFNDYFIGDEVPVYTSRRLRQAQGTLERVHAIPIQIDNNGVETVRALLTADESVST